MTKTLFLFVGLFFLCSCASLKTKKENWPSIEEILELENILNKVDYGRKYKENVFDCSNQTAFLYDFLTKKGYKCKIMFGSTLLAGDKNHVWLVVEKNRKIFFVESTLKKIIHPYYLKIYILRIEFDSLEEAKGSILFLGTSNEWKY